MMEATTPSVPAGEVFRPAQALVALRGEREFRKVRQHGVVVRTPLFTLRVTVYRPRYGEVWRPRAMVGIVVPKKTLKHAVKRNRVRRRVREALRTLPALPACRATIHPTAACQGVPFDTLQTELRQALMRGLSTSASSKKAGKNAGKGAGKPKSPQTAVGGGRSAG